MTRTISFKAGLGINRDQLPSELAPGLWSDCQNMRFRNGNDERRGGMAAVFTTPLVAPYWLQPYAVGAASSITRNLVYCGLAQAYVDDGTTQTEITRRTDIRITSLSRAANVGTAVTASAHGLSVGNSFIIYGSALNSGGNSGFNGTWTVSTVPNATTVTFATTGSDATEDLPGLLSKSATANFTATADTKITGGVLSGVLILNSPNDGIYYWAGDPTVKLRRLVALNPTYDQVADVARPYGAYIVMLGRRSATGVKRPYTIAWSASVDPGSVPFANEFVAATTNDAGEVDKAETPGALVDMCAYGDTNVVYKEDARIAMAYVGGNSVFSFRYLPGSDGLLAAGCVVNTPKGQAFLTQNFDLKIHQGGEAQSVGEGRVKKWIRDNIDATNYKRAFLTVNKQFSEVMVCIPTTGNSTCNKALLWNWNDDTWGESDLTAVTAGVSGQLPTSVATGERTILGSTTPRLALLDSGTTDFGSSFTSMLERKGITADMPAAKKTMHTSRWDIDGTGGNTSSIFHGSHTTPRGSVTYATAVTHTVSTTRDVNAFANSAEYLALKMTTTASPWANRSVEADYEMGGRF